MRATVECRYVEIRKLICLRVESSDSVQFELSEPNGAVGGDRDIFAHLGSRGRIVRDFNFGNARLGDCVTEAGCLRGEQGDTREHSGWQKGGVRSVR